MFLRWIAIFCVVSMTALAADIQIPWDINGDRTAVLRHQDTNEPLARAQDYAHAFHRLRELQPERNIYLIAKGISYEPISAFEVMPQESLVIITVSYSHRDEQKVLRVEDLQELGVR